MENDKVHLDLTDINNPKLICHDGTVKVLTKFELWMVQFGIYSLEFLDSKYNSEPQRG